MTDKPYKWVAVAGYLHARRRSAAVCGATIGPGIRAMPHAQAQHLADTAGFRFCGECASAVRAAGGDVPAAVRARLSKLTPPQRQIRRTLDAEQERRRRLREAEASGRGEQSRSVRAVSGGLPTLGRRR